MFREWLNEMATKPVAFNVAGKIMCPDCNWKGEGEPLTPAKVYKTFGIRRGFIPGPQAECKECFRRFYKDQWAYGIEPTIVGYDTIYGPRCSGCYEGMPHEDRGIDREPLYSGNRHECTGCGQNWDGWEWK